MQNIDMQWQLPEGLAVKGNRNLLYSIFRNLADNAIRYAGNGATINISTYDENRDFYYFSFYDTGGSGDSEKRRRFPQR